MMTRVELRLAILKATFHPGKNIEQMTEIVLGFEAQLFGDLPLDEPAAGAPPAANATGKGTKPAR